MTTTPTLRDRLDAWCNTDDADLRDERLYHLLNAFTTKFEALEPPCPSTTGTSPESSSTNSTATPIPLLGVSHGGGGRWGKPLPLAGPYYELCLCSAASTAGSECTSTPVALPTPCTSIPKDSPSPPPPAPSPSASDASGCDGGSTAPADRPAVPAWCEDGQIDVYFLSTKEINSGVAALRADRDYWREQAKHWKANHDDQVRIKRNLHEMYDEQAYRLNSSLQAQCDKQLATITELQKVVAASSDAVIRDALRSGRYTVSANPPKSSESLCDCGKIEHGRHHMNCPALNPPEPPKSSWRERCRVVKKVHGWWDILSGDGRWYWSNGAQGWVREHQGDPTGCYSDEQRTREILASITTPPPGETS